MTFGHQELRWCYYRWSSWDMAPDTFPSSTMLLEFDLKFQNEDVEIVFYWFPLQTIIIRSNIYESKI